MITSGGIITSEAIGTAVMIFLGLATSLQGWSRGHGAGAGAAGWALAVFTGASIADSSGAHLNPAITVAQALASRVDWSAVPAYLIGEALGAMAGGLLAACVFRLQIEDGRGDSRLVGLFATLPERESPGRNVLTEALATSVLVTFVLTSPGSSVEDGVYHFGNEGLGYAAVALVIFVLTIGAGGPTSAAMNPFRDLGPRLVYTVLFRRPSWPSARWDYAWVPTVGPLLGSGVGAALSLALRSVA